MGESPVNFESSLVQMRACESLCPSAERSSGVPLRAQLHLRIPASQKTCAHHHRFQYRNPRPQSANGVIVGDQRIQKTTVKPDDVITLGNTQIQLIQTRQPESVGESTDIAFTRPPQVLPRVGRRRFKLPDCPQLPEPARFPVIALLMPLVMGAVMFAITRQVYSVLFVALSPLMMIGSSWDQKRQNKKALEIARLHFDQALAAIREEVQVHQNADRELGTHSFPQSNRSSRVHYAETAPCGCAAPSIRNFSNFV